MYISLLIAAVANVMDIDHERVNRINVRKNINKVDNNGHFVYFVLRCMFQIFGTFLILRKLYLQITRIIPVLYR